VFEVTPTRLTIEVRKPHRFRCGSRMAEFSRRLAPRFVARPLSGAAEAGHGLR
jgi:hypothetical protein